ncbi:MAG: NAD(P)H-dependent oxidoreductase [Beijerinckiaceae bacterium]|nr:NAD(P)H-dependent oxidoreductase [Beijerinckiaceae bacterium]MCZ8299707.1 NAD(P)H-dependent oxidoreductase [Beijerinckiaceae bacterium]
MKILLIYCHPCKGSFTEAARDVAMAALQSAGHEVDLLDLYAEGFDPVMSEAERTGYHTRGENRVPVASHLDRVKAAEGLVFVYPTWWYAQPAMLKGWLERVLIPHETFTMPEGNQPIRGLMQNIRVLAVVTSLGSPKWWWWLVGRPGQRILLSGIRVLCHPKCRTIWLALHRIDVVGEDARKAHLERVRAVLGAVR